MQKDFFISYNKADERWATWIAWTLEQTGSNVVIQAWDFRPGSNFVLEMQKAASEAKRTIAVLSPNYIKSSFTQPEWAAAFAKDPQGKTKTLVPVVVEKCDVEGILGPIVHINITGLSEELAREKLLAGLEPGRSKPIVSPSFPGSVHSNADHPITEESSLVWTPTDGLGAVAWRGQLPSIRREGGASALEIHMLPQPGQHLAVRKLGELQAGLVGLGRARGFFSDTEGIKPVMDDQLVYCQTLDDNSNSGKGILVTRIGQRGAWLTLPKDDLGSILDLEDVRPRLVNILEMLLNVPAPLANNYAFAIRVAPCLMLMLGSANILGVRSSATMPYAMSHPDSVDVLPEDYVSVDAISANLDEVVEELLARVQAQFAKSS
jgi:hypothetical protein